MDRLIIKKDKHLTLEYDKIGQEYFVMDSLNHKTYWFKTLTFALKQFNKLKNN